MTVNINIHSCQGRVEHSNAYFTLKPTSPLNQWVQEFWQLNVPDGRYFYRSVPDNCVDMIINLTFPEDAFIVTPFSSAKIFEMIGPVSYFGIRFCTLGHQGIISTPLGGWNNVDNVISMNDILPKHVLHAVYDGIYKMMSFQKRCDYFLKMLLGVLQPLEIDSRLMRYILYCNQNIKSTVDLSDRQCSRFGVSARQLRRLTRQYLGLAPKEFSKVLRFQKILQGMYAENLPALWANDYYDQSHFHRDFKNMSGVTPNEFLKLSVLYNTD